MRIKNILVILGIIIFFSGVVYVTLLDQNSMYIHGYIPIEEKPDLFWDQNGYHRGRINVITEEGQKIKVNFMANGVFNGSSLVTYRNENPKAKDKKVFVSILKKGNEITKASIDDN